ncbi:LppP/LprE family lipoprotein [Streptomyces sp. NPDC101165]|uniref:LppP/LprE family lipoprotein n=1 Tax=Streptomyces sp. NPDC101165 TaxID=3366119 RepID=UPI0037F94E8D
MRRPAVTAAVAAALCLVPVTACGSSGDQGRPDRSPSVSVWGTHGAGQPSDDAKEPFDADRAVLRIKRLHYTADTSLATLKKLRGPLRAIHAYCTGTQDGHCVAVFFFHGNDYAGYDANGVNTSTIVRQDGTAVTLSYPVFLPTDPMCCHTGGEREYRARWQNGKVVFTPPLPENPNYPDT